MGWDTTPWAVGNGAEHSAEVARLIPYVALSGEEGIGGPNHLTVRALATPGQSVTVDTGTVAINSRASDGGHQSYLSRMISRDTVTVPPNTSSTSSRTDLIVARVEDPNPVGNARYPTPTDVKRGPYIFTRCVQGVPAGTTRLQNVSGYANDSAITLARVTQPPNTGAVTQSMVTDLRTVAQPRRRSELYVTAITAADGIDYLDQTAALGSDGEWWPNQAVQSVYIPLWATSVKVVATWSQVKFTAAASTGNLWVRIGPSAGPYKETQRVAWNSLSSSDTSRGTIVCAADVAIPASMRGTTVEVGLRGHRDTGTGNVSTDLYSSTVLQMEFVESPDPT